MKKILQSISLLLLLLAISSELLAQTYERSTGGSWNNAAQWTPKGVPNGDKVQVTLNNAETKLLNLNLGGKSYQITKLNVPDKANDWRLFNGTLAFHKVRDHLAEIDYSGTGNLILETHLNLQSDTVLNVSDSYADVDLAGPISGSGKLLKIGPGALLIEQPLGASIEIYEGIIGISRQNYPENYPNLTIDKDSGVKLFALDDNINITKVKLLRGTTLDLINNPYPGKPTHDITLGKDLYGPEDSTINQLSRSALIFEGINRFYGTIKSGPESGPIIIDGHTYANIETQPGAGPIILNGSTGGNIEINGSTIEGTGRGGNLTATSGAIISPGYNGSFGTLSFRNVNLDSNTILNFKFHNVKEDLTIGGMLRELKELEKSKSVDPEKEKYLTQVERIKIDIDAASRDLIRVSGDLALRGKLNINVDAVSKLENGTYPLFKYNGELINDGLGISSVPPGTMPLTLP